MNRLHSLTPPFSDRSASCRADRRSDPTPDDTKSALYRFPPVHSADLEGGKGSRAVVAQKIAIISKGRKADLLGSRREQPELIGDRAFGGTREPKFPPPVSTDRLRR